MPIKPTDIPAKYPAWLSTGTLYDLQGLGWPDLPEPDTEAVFTQTPWNWDEVKIVHTICGDIHIYHRMYDGTGYGHSMNFNPDRDSYF